MSLGSTLIAAIGSLGFGRSRHTYGADGDGVTEGAFPGELKRAEAEGSEESALHSVHLFPTGSPASSRQETELNAFAMCFP